MLINVNKLKGKIIENGLSIETLAAEMGIDRSTLYRKLKNDGDTMLIKDANKIVKILNLTTTEAMDIFFSQFVAEYANYKMNILGSWDRA